MSTKRIIATIVSLLVAITALGLAFSIFKNVSSASKDALNQEAIQSIESKKDKTDSPVQVNAITVKNQASNEGLYIQGRLRAYDKTDLIAEVPGMLKPVNKRFKIGTRYNQDELIFEVDDTEARLSLQAQKAQLQTAITQMMPDLKIDMPNSFSQWKSYLDNFNLNSSVRTFPKALSERETYYVSLKGIQAQYYTIKSAEKRLSKYQVRAPFNGIMTSVNVGDSGYLRAGSPLGTIMNTSQYELEAAVPVAELKYIKKGRSVKILSDDTGKSWRGTVKRISDMIDPTTQAATVYIGASGAGLREGQYLRAEIKSSGGGAIAILPRNVVSKDMVHIITDGTLSQKRIELVRIEGDNALVRGLADGTKVAQGENLSGLIGQSVSIVQ